MRYFVGDFAIITNEGKPQSWLRTEIGKTVEILFVDTSGWVMARKLDHTLFKLGIDPCSDGDIWMANLSPIVLLQCAECDRPIPFDNVDYLCQSCRNV